MPVMLRALLGLFTDRLAAAAVDSPRLSAEILLAHSLCLSRSDLLKQLILEPDTQIPPESLAVAEAFITRRESGEPSAYILGVKEFYGRDFAVTPSTLIPRPETETLVETALAFAANRKSCSTPPLFIDLGSGSGAIAVTLALELPAWRGVAVDISPGALNIARQNAQILGAANLEFSLCDFLSPALPQGQFDMVLSNPPYVSEVEYNAISYEIRGFEPKIALVPDAENATGLEHLFGIFSVAERVLIPGGLLLMEMGSTQGDVLMERAVRSSAWNDCRVICDLAGLPRLFHAVLANRYVMGEEHRSLIFS